MFGTSSSVRQEKIVIKTQSLQTWTSEESWFLLFIKVSNINVSLRQNSLEMAFWSLITCKITYHLHSCLESRNVESYKAATLVPRIELEEV